MRCINIKEKRAFQKSLEQKPRVTARIPGPLARAPAAPSLLPPPQPRAQRAPPPSPPPTPPASVYNLRDVEAALCHSIVAGVSPGTSLLPGADIAWGRAEFWKGVVQRLDAIPEKARNVLSGTWNRVFLLTQERETEIQFAPSIPAVVRLSTKKNLEFAPAARELALTHLAAKAGYGVPVFFSSILLKTGPVDTPIPAWRLVIVMERGRGTLESRIRDLQPNDERAASVAVELVTTLALLSGQKILALDTKPTNAVSIGDRVYLIDFDGWYTFEVDLHPQCLLLLHLMLMAMHIRAHLRSSNGAAQILRELQAPTLALWLHVKDQKFPGASLVANLRMPPANEKSKYGEIPVNHKFDSPEQRVKWMLPRMCYDYFFSAEPKIRDAVAHQWYHGSGYGGQPALLVPQLLAYAFFFKQTVPEEFQEALRF